MESGGKEEEDKRQSHYCRITSVSNEGRTIVKCPLRKMSHAALRTASPRERYGPGRGGIVLSVLAPAHVSPPVRPKLAVIGGQSTSGVLADSHACKYGFMTNKISGRKAQVNEPHYPIVQKLLRSHGARKKVAGATAELRQWKIWWKVPVYPFHPEPSVCELGGVGVKLRRKWRGGMSGGEEDFQLSPYVATPESTSKGVIHGIPAYDTPEAITASIVPPANPKALQARRIGITSTAIIVFDGYKVPPYIYYRGAEYRCYIHCQKMEACLTCGDKGHRADACPRPNPPRCRRCGDHLVETSSHTCEPKCTLCGGAHPLGDRSCKQRFKATPPRGKTASLRKQWREDSTVLSSPPEVTTKSPPASHEQHPACPPRATRLCSFCSSHTRGHHPREKGTVPTFQVGKLGSSGGLQLIFPIK
ncbi:hypothetical protein HPB48_024434 [Haemaphysalis longicornis]|uniref:CCHC-type domain-containing protein n=1 Tax=Haemaphysalis longicornis TaxID=44386 RepID=A0A9J6H8A6_HAELO|nr:hypothetical protein HPB48_024434 [Haemaphysalis longicornis]